MSVGSIGSADTDLYQKVDDVTCRCKWCGWLGNVYVLPRSAHERSTKHRQAARERGVEIESNKARQLKRLQRKDGDATEHSSNNGPDIRPAPAPPLEQERAARKLPKPKANWHPSGVMTREWTTKTNTVFTALRVRQVGRQEDNDFLAYKGFTYLGSETSLERAQALAEHPELA